MLAWKQRTVQAHRSLPISHASRQPQCTEQQHFVTLTHVATSRALPRVHVCVHRRSRRTGVAGFVWTDNQVAPLHSRLHSAAHRVRANHAAPEWVQLPTRDVLNAWRRCSVLTHWRGSARTALFCARFLAFFGKGCFTEPWRDAVWRGATLGSARLVMARGGAVRHGDVAISF